MTQAEEDMEVAVHETATQLAAEEDARILDQIQGDFLFPHQQESLTRQILCLRKVETK